MKKMMMIAALTVAAVSAMAQSDKSPVDAYFTTSEMPDMLKWCPAPPDTASSAFAYDITQYFWGKKMRNCKERADIAIRDAVYGLDCIIREFSEPFGLQISKEETPEIYKVLREGTATCDSICTFPKRYYMRKRPFMRFNEATLYPADEPALRKNGSFPSGHTLLGWSSAHWQSDVDAARLAASAAYARLHTSERFLEQMRLARQEFRVKKGLATIVEMKAYKKAAAKRAKAARR